MDKPPASGSEADRLGVRDLGVLGVVWVLYAALVARFWFVADDAFITFRYAKNWVGEAGLRYNLESASPVEGYSNFLWMVVAAVFEAVGVDVTIWVPLLSAILGTALLAAIFRVARRHCGLSPWLAGVVTATAGLFPSFAVWSTSGLETMAFAFAMFFTFERLVLAPGGPRPLAAGFAGVAMALLRVEGIAWAVVLVPLCVYTATRTGRPVRRAVGVYLGLVATGYLIYFVGRYAYFDTLLANTAAAKVTFGSGILLRGLRYVGTQVVTFVTPMALVATAVSALQPARRAVGLPTLALACGVPLWAILVGGDFMAMGRFVVPAIPFAAVTLGWLIADLTARVEGRSAPATAVGVVLIVIGLLPGWDVHLVPRSIREPLNFRYGRTYQSEFSRWEMQRRNAQHWADRGRALAAVSGPGQSLVTTAIGAVGYYSDLFIYDQHGLVTPEVLRDSAREGRDETGRPGHDRGVEPEFFLDREPTYMLVKGPMPAANVPAAASVATSKIEALTIQDRYVTAVIPAGETRDGSADSYLVLARRIPEQTSATEAWRAHRESVARLTSGGAR